MDVLVAIALVVAVIFCALPGIMAWSFYSGRKHASAKRHVIRHTQPAKA